MSHLCSTMLEFTLALYRFCLSHRPLLRGDIVLLNRLLIAEYPSDAQTTELVSLTSNKNVLDGRA